MRRLLCLLAIIPLFLAAPATAIALAGDAARFDFLQGQPAVADDSTATCNNQATVRYDFLQGQPAPVYDTTATCASATAAATPRVILYPSGGRVILNGRMVIQ